MMGYGDGWWGMAWLGMGPFMLLFWIGVALLVVLLVRAALPGQRPEEEDSALAVLRRRYAAGEISQAEYEQARRVLSRATAGEPDATVG